MSLTETPVPVCVRVGKAGGVPGTQRSSEWFGVERTRGGGTPVLGRTGGTSITTSGSALDDRVVRRSSP